MHAYIPKPDTMYDAIYDIVNERAGRALEMKENEAYMV
jgi:hypothetical protein